MGIIQSLHHRLQTSPWRLRRVREAAQYLMDYVGLHGRCECLGMRDAEGRSALLVIVTTKLNVPVAEREQFQPYVQRKLAEWGEIDHLPVMVVIRDAQDLARAQRTGAQRSA